MFRHIAIILNGAVAWAMGRCVWHDEVFRDKADKRLDPKIPEGAPVMRCRECLTAWTYLEGYGNRPAEPLVVPVDPVPAVVDLAAISERERRLVEMAKPPGRLLRRVG